MTEVIVQPEQLPEKETQHSSDASINLSGMSELSNQTEVFLVQRPKRVELSEEEVIKRMEEFSSRKDKFVAAIREGKNRSLYP